MIPNWVHFEPKKGPCDRPTGSRKSGFRAQAPAGMILFRENIICVKKNRTFKVWLWQTEFSNCRRKTWQFILSGIGYYPLSRLIPDRS